MSLLALVGYWLNQSEKLKHGWLGLKRLFRIHSGQNQAELVWAIISQYHIQNTLNYFTLDNASNSSTALWPIQYQLDQHKASNKILSSDMDFASNSRYIRYYGHDLNLIVKVFLYAKKSYNLIKDKAAKQPIDKDMNHWSIGEKLAHWGSYKISL